MKVYVLTEEWTLEGNKHDLGIKVYYTRYQAEDAMEERVKSSKNCFKHINKTVHDKYIKGVSHWGISQKDNYNNYHINLDITECEVA